MDVALKVDGCVVWVVVEVVNVVPAVGVARVAGIISLLLLLLLVLGPRLGLGLLADFRDGLSVRRRKLLLAVLIVGGWRRVWVSDGRWRSVLLH